VRARAQVFFDGSGGILDGHVPAAEVNHPPTHLPVDGVQWSLFQMWSSCGQFSHHAPPSFRAPALLKITNNR